MSAQPTKPASLPITVMASDIFTMDRTAMGTYVIPLRDGRTLVLAAGAARLIAWYVQQKEGRTQEERPRDDPGGTHESPPSAPRQAGLASWARRLWSGR